MARNPETVVTKWLRDRVKLAGGFTIKLSDSYTRGVPDLMVTTDRVIMVEMKFGDQRDRYPVARYGVLGASGAQDQNIREICRRSPTGACLVTVSNPCSDVCMLWVPMVPDKVGTDFEMYRCAAVGVEGVLRWMGLT